MEIISSSSSSSSLSPWGRLTRTIIRSCIILATWTTKATKIVSAREIIGIDVSGIPSITVTHRRTEEPTVSGIPTYATTVTEEPIIGIDNNCGTKTSCNECPETPCVWSTGFCLEFCAYDVPCYSMEYSKEDSVAGVCAIAANHRADDTLCRNKSGCTSCVESVLSNGVSTCQWRSE